MKLHRPPACIEAMRRLHVRHRSSCVPYGLLAMSSPSPPPKVTDDAGWSTGNKHGAPCGALRHPPSASEQRAETRVNAGTKKAPASTDGRLRALFHGRPIPAARLRAARLGSAAHRALSSLRHACACSWECKCDLPASKQRRRARCGCNAGRLHAGGGHRLAQGRAAPRARRTPDLRRELHRKRGRFRAVRGASGGRYGFPAHACRSTRIHR